MKTATRKKVIAMFAAAFPGPLQSFYPYAVVKPVGFEKVNINDGKKNPMRK